MKKEYNLFLDDIRYPKDVTWIKLPNVEWTIVRNYQEFVEIIEKNGIPIICSFDHDLADEHYVEYHNAHNSNNTEQKIHYENFVEKSGYDCAKWLANYCVDTNTPIPLYYLHSLNPIGRQNIFSILESARKAMLSK